jgi:hypothetical protein
MCCRVLQPLRCTSRRSLALLCAQLRPRPIRQSVSASGAGAGGSGSSDSDLDGEGVGPRTAIGADRPLGGGHLPCLAYGWAPHAAAAAALASVQEVAAAAAKAAETEAAAEAAAAREALEAELQAVLAEETGVLASMDDTAEEDGECEGDSGGVSPACAAPP